MVGKYTHRGKTRWYFQIEQPGSGRSKRDRIRKFGFETQKEAKAAETAALYEQQKTQELKDPAAGPSTLEGLLEKFFELHSDDLAPKTAQNYRSHLPRLDQQLLRSKPDQITQFQWTSEWKRLEREGGRTRRNTPRPISAATVRSVAAVISSAYNWAAEQGLVKTNPVTHSQWPRPQKKEAVTVSDANLELLLEHDGGFWCRAAYLAAAEALGHRRGELCALRWSDWRGGRMAIARSLTQFRDRVTGERRIRFKSTKGNKVHFVTVPKLLIPVLEAHRRRQNALRQQFGPTYEDHDLIFAQENGAPLWPDSVSASISKLCRRLGLPKGTCLHSLRHTHASVLLEAGTPLTVVSKRLGHASVLITATTYAHALHAEDDRAAAAYDDYRSRAREGVANDARVQ